MDIAGYIAASRPEYRLGEPISLTLFVRNEGKDVVYLFVPRGRADGIRVQVKEGQGWHLRDMTQEPEPGLVPERKLNAGETYSQEFALGDWLVLNKPGPYTLDCQLEVEVNDRSLRDSQAARASEMRTIGSEVRFAVLPTGSA